MSKYNVVVVGAGILGLCSAYHIKRQNPDEKILIIDKFGSAGQGNTAKSEACFRNVFSSKTNFALANSTVDFYLHVHRELKHDLGLHLIGYLFLFSEDDYKRNKDVLEEMQRRGVELEYFERGDLERMIPGAVLEFDEKDEEAKMMNLESVEKGVLGKKCGYLEVEKLVNFYEEEFKRVGGEIRYNTVVQSLIIEPVKKFGVPGEPFVWQDSRITGVKTNRGEIRADTVVVATGAWTNALLDPIGVDSHIKPKKRQIFAVKGPSLEPLFNAKGFNDENILPFTILPKAGIYFRPDIGEGSCWVGCGDELGRAFKFEEEPQPEENYYFQDIYQVLRKYFPHFEGLKPQSSWAGLYAINTIDANPYVFREAGMIVVTGASGSGILKADAIGRVAAGVYMEEKYVEFFDGEKFRVSDLGVENRHVEKERFVL